MQPLPTLPDTVTVPPAGTELGATLMPACAMAGPAPSSSPARVSATAMSPREAMWRSYPLADPPY